MERIEVGNYVKVLERVANIRPGELAKVVRTNGDYTFKVKPLRPGAKAYLSYAREGLSWERVPGAERVKVGNYVRLLEPIGSFWPGDVTPVLVSGSLTFQLEDAGGRVVLSHATEGRAWERLNCCEVYKTTTPRSAVHSRYGRVFRTDTNSMSGLATFTATLSRTEAQALVSLVDVNRHVFGRVGKPLERLADDLEKALVVMS